MNTRRLPPRTLLACLLLGLGSWLARAEQEDFELPPIRYSKTAPNDAVTRIEKRIRSGELKFAPGDDKTLLLALLKELKVPVESQIMVFSKTSKQRSIISPTRPRVMYFSDDCYVGWVPGGAMELTTFDPVLGATFYLVEPHDELVRPKFTRADDCLSCHARSSTGNAPGLLARSVFPDDRGEPIFSAGSTFVTHETPFSERWGGWYVTGQHGTARHRGNVFAKQSKDGADLDMGAGANLSKLDAFFDPKPYPLDRSDIVALMVVEHQVGMHNALCEANMQARLALYRWKGLCEALKEDPDQPLYGSTLSVINHYAEKVLKQLLFVGEAALPDGGIQGAASFQTAFAATKKTDGKGRSLRDFDLKTRIFRNRCSHLIYSRTFDTLPPVLRETILNRLWTILTEDKPAEPFNHLPATERAAIREILQATKEGLPPVWKRKGG